VDVHRWTNRYYQCEEETIGLENCGDGCAVAGRELEGPAISPVLDLFDPHEPWIRRIHGPPLRQGIPWVRPMLHPELRAFLSVHIEELRNLWAHYAAESELVDRLSGVFLQKVDDPSTVDESISWSPPIMARLLGTGLAGKCKLGLELASFQSHLSGDRHVPFLIAGRGVPKGTDLGT